MKSLEYTLGPIFTRYGSPIDSTIIGKTLTKIAKAAATPVAIPKSTKMKTTPPSCKPKPEGVMGTNPREVINGWSKK